MEKKSLKIEPAKYRRGKWAIGTFDIETIPEHEGESALIGKFSLGATCLDSDGHSVLFWDSEIEMLKYMLSYYNKVRWFAHNGGRFDFKYIISPECLKMVTDAGYQIKPIGTTIVKGLLFTHTRSIRRLMICDSAKLMPSSLKDLCGAFKVATPKGFIDFENENFDKTSEVHRGYLRDDVISLYQVMTAYRSTINEYFGVEPKCTASSTAFMGFRHTLTDNVYRHSTEVDEFCRKAYFGGRSQPFAIGEFKNVSYIDVNSLYPFIMRSLGSLANPEYVAEYKGTGFYSILADVPRTVTIPPLPYRPDKHGGLWFPTGKFLTTCSSLEIDIALELGCKIEVIEGYHFKTNDVDTFKPFVDKCERLRSVDYSGALGLIAKFTQNNCYGYFGMKQERDEIQISEDCPKSEPGEEDWVQYVDANCNVVPNLWQRNNTQDQPNIVPAWAAWITAGARVYLLRALLAEVAAGNRILMCDTDSIFLQGKPVSFMHSTQYGAFKLEAYFDRFVAVASKCYLGTSNVKDMLKCKGVPRKLLLHDDYDKIMAGEKITKSFTQVNSFTKVLTTGLKGVPVATRSMPTLESATNIVPQKIGENCLPIHLNEV